MTNDSSIAQQGNIASFTGLSFLRKQKDKSVVHHNHNIIYNLFLPYFPLNFSNLKPYLSWIIILKIPENIGLWNGWSCSSVYLEGNTKHIHWNIIM